jgi:cell wall-associated NlpC family hydrolase
MSIARRAVAYAALTTALALLALALIAAMPEARAWAAQHSGGLSARGLEPEEVVGEEGLEEGEEGPAGQALLVRGRAIPPQDAPREVRRMINAANRIRSKPYVWGGGHRRWWDRGYDCSGAVGYALHGAGLLETPMTSGSMERLGEPGPGRWITIYANGGHVYAVVAGLRWDTAGNRRGISGPRWHENLRAAARGRFVVRHPEGL